MQKNYWERPQNEVSGLAADAKQEKYASKMREEIFNKQWQRWLQEISQTVQPVRHASNKRVDLEVCRVLEEQYNAHSHLVTEKLTKQPLERRHLKIDYVHLDSTQSINNLTKNSKTVITKFGSTGHYAEVNEV